MTETGPIGGTKRISESGSPKKFRNRKFPWNLKKDIEEQHFLCNPLQLMACVREKWGAPPSIKLTFFLPL